MHIRRGFFYLLDYVTPAEKFQIGNRKKKKKKMPWTLCIVIFTMFIKVEGCVKKINFFSSNDNFTIIFYDTKSKYLPSGVRQNPFFFF